MVISAEIYLENVRKFLPYLGISDLQNFSDCPK